MLAVRASVIQVNVGHQNLKYHNLVCFEITMQSLKVVCISLDFSGWLLLKCALLSLTICCLIILEKDIECPGDSILHQKTERLCQPEKFPQVISRTQDTAPDPRQQSRWAKWKGQLGCSRFLPRHHANKIQNPVWLPREVSFGSTVFGWLRKAGDTAGSLEEPGDLVLFKKD